MKLGPFSGIFPKLGNRFLPENAAQSASNVKLHSGELSPLNGAGLVTTPSKTMPPLSIFKARDSATGSSAWFSWPVEADCVRAPFPVEVESRFCWVGDGIPKMATFSSAVAGGGNNYPATEFTLGIPAPQTAPTVTPSGGVSATVVDRFYCVTFFSSLGEESAPSPVSTMVSGKIDGSWAITGIDVTPPNSGGISALTYVGSSVTVTAADAHYNRVGEQVVIAGVTTVGNVNGSWVLDAVDTAAKTMTFTVDVAPTGTYNNATDTTDTWARLVPWNTSGMVKRVYRTTGTTGSWQLVNETGIASATTTYTDTLTDAQIAGDELISDGWVPAPVGITALCLHPSGSLIGMWKNIVCASEPYQPHAWPEAYRRAAGYDGVGIACFGSSVVMATQGVPFIVSGVEPSSMSGEDAQDVYPCLSKRGVVSHGGSVLYVSKHGIVQVGPNGVSLFTDPWFTKEQWGELNPETMVLEVSAGRVYVAYTNTSGTNQMLVFDGGALVNVTVQAKELYTDPATNELYLGMDGGIYLYDDPNEVVLPGQWKSKEFMFAAPVNIGAGKVDFNLAVDEANRSATLAAIAAAEAINAAILSTGNAGGSINTRLINAKSIGGSDFVEIPASPANNSITFNLWTGDRLRASRVVSSANGFKLPGGYKADAYSVEIITQCTVKETRFAETLDGLRRE